MLIHLHCLRSRVHSECIAITILRNTFRGRADAVHSCTIYGGRKTVTEAAAVAAPEKKYWRLRRLESAVPAQLALKNVTLRKGRDTLCKVRQSGTCCAEREQPICTASRWQLMESLSGTAVSSTVAIVGSIWPKGPAQAGPAIQAQWVSPSRSGQKCGSILGSMMTKRTHSVITALSVWLSMAQPRQC